MAAEWTGAFPAHGVRWVARPVGDGQSWLYEGEGYAKSAHPSPLRGHHSRCGVVRGDPPTTVGP